MSPKEYKLPDMAICRADSARMGDMAYCLLHFPDCKFFELINDKGFCFHPLRDDIVSRTIIERSAKRE